MKKIILFVFVFVFALNYTPVAFAQTNAARARVEAMFEAFEPGQLKFAIHSFANNSLIPDELVDYVASQAENVITLERPILGFEFLHEQNAGESVKRLTYILKLTDRPLYWNFSFYRPTNEWIPLRMYFFEEP